MNCWNLVLVGVSVGICVYARVFAMTSANTLEVLQRGGSHRYSTSMPWSFLEAEFPEDARVTSVDVLYDSAVCPLTTLETVGGEQEHAAS
jgi:hypothetical protein